MGSRNVLDELPGRWSGTQVRRALLEGIEAEGPIHLDRLARSVAAAFDLTRVSAARTEAIVLELPSWAVRDSNERFAWPQDLDPAAWRGFRRAQEAEPRPLGQVSLREIGNAMVSLCEAAAGMYEEELLRDALGVFGGRRLTSVISGRLTHALNRVLAEERLSRGAGGLYIVP